MSFLSVTSCKSTEWKSDRNSEVLGNKINNDTSNIQIIPILEGGLQ